MRLPAIIYCTMLLLLANRSSAQDTLSRPVSSSFVEAIGSKATKLEKKLAEENTRALRATWKAEKRLLRKLARRDSAAAALLASSYTIDSLELSRSLSDVNGSVPYSAAMDTLRSSLSFLQQVPGNLTGKLPAGKVQQALGKVKGMDDQFRQAEVVKNFMEKRKTLLKEQFNKLGLTKELKQLNKQVYYYKAQIAEYKSLLNDHKKAVRKGLALLSRTNQFQQFLKKHSQLASLFRLPGTVDPSNMASLAGLQTRTQVNNLIQQQIASGGPNALAQVQQNMQQAQATLNQLKEKAMKIVGAGGDPGNPAEGFKPNHQKTKSFLKRLEWGVNIQSQKARGYFPSHSDIGLSVGYKLNDKSIIGVGASYKVGWGRDIRHIKVTHQGVSLRSFVDWQLKGSFWLTGGYEMNYRNTFRQLEELRSLDAWQQSGLIGVSKVVSLKTKLLKKTKLMLLWDFLSTKQKPRTQAVLFRVGYTF